MKTTKTLTTFLALMTFVACGKAPVGSVALVLNADTVKAQPQDAEPSAPVAPQADAAPVSVAAPASPSVTTVTGSYFTKTKSEAPITGWSTKTYTAQGSCLVYQSKTYCWDDGLKVLQWTSGGHTYGPYGYTYFGVGTIANGSQTFQGQGALVSDLAVSPRVITASMESNMLVSSSTVLTTGAPTSVTCTDDGSTLNCGTFSIDLNQSPL